MTAAFRSISGSINRCETIFAQSPGSSGDLAAKPAQAVRLIASALSDELSSNADFALEPGETTVWFGDHLLPPRSISVFQPIIVWRSCRGDISPHSTPSVAWRF